MKMNILQFMTTRLHNSQTAFIKKMSGFWISPRRKRKKKQLREFFARDEFFSRKSILVFEFQCLTTSTDDVHFSDDEFRMKL